ncbi:TPA: DNA adenine methylase [Yersinia enterocolitica]|nr:Dam family site-specific DNA-(adenine-N6)-methyltransferase [Yersinia enterocolitica]HDL6910724.1 Dam family site-specific DNA-(adenine-N6)-methyltransferase [Yersinia enterocolitica]HDL7029000.1 Dam family site-specific DNA-(adenine-N6)-methyltransferase [Yersinia enterocolitica]HDL7037858.1 Dam family site-specific DNA-(adenine-N6)-methyltransferase [Yersinia enterocolitica]HDL7628568.1 Dam family site-specific DNA-(adenine-N6)-methyltransferase [Yersinia enterocolitica]
MFSPLKWAGSKGRIMPTLRQHLPAGKRLVEPFAGSCSVMLNTDYDEYLIADVNSDLINFYQQLQKDCENIIDLARELFKFDNSEANYYLNRQYFNERELSNEYRAAMFLYLNRHCHGGICRYNQKGEFNVPYGKYKAPYFPETEIRYFAEKAQKATFVCCDFSEALKTAAQGDVVYCDPPYIPTSATADFTHYHTGGFNLDDQHQLAEMLAWVADRGCYVIASNSDTPIARDLYSRFDIHGITAPRSASCKSDGRKAVGEIIAIRPLTRSWAVFDPAGGPDSTVMIEIPSLDTWRVSCE